MIDLCSGLGGASEAAIDRGWEVWRIDNDPKFVNVPNTIIHNIKDYRELDLPEHVDFVWASPPCNCFSIASVYRHWDKDTKRPKHKGVIDAMRIVFWCMDFIDYIKPKYWVIENPRGMMRQILGEPGKVLPGVTTYLYSWGSPQMKPTDLWGILPDIDWPPNPTKIKPSPTKYAGCGKDGHKDMRPSNKEERAKMPYKLGEALCKAIEMDRAKGWF